MRISDTSTTRHPLQAFCRAWRYGAQGGSHGKVTSIRTRDGNSCHDQSMRLVDSTQLWADTFSLSGRIVPLFRKKQVAKLVGLATAKKTKSVSPEPCSRQAKEPSAKGEACRPSTTRLASEPRFGAAARSAQAPFAQSNQIEASSPTNARFARTCDDDLKLSIR